jgi:3-phenylpropionate/trans-cinnamate dioxygenase ferredoxin reductase subunit
MNDPCVVIVGAGHAGGTFAALLRRAGFNGKVVLIGSEAYYPYHRPPLSKSFQEGGPTKWLYEASFYTDNAIAVRLGDTVASIDRDSSEIKLLTGEKVAYDYLVIATGAEPRRLPIDGSDLVGVRSLRSLSDAQALKGSIAEGHPLIIVGGGYVGLEVAAAARSRGVDVTILEREARLLARVASPSLSSLLAKHHVAQGIKILTDADVTRFTSNNGHVQGVELSDGRVLPSSSVLVGAGAIPREELAAHAGLVCNGGILVDNRAVTSDPKILAIGDVTQRPLSFGDISTMRLESIPSAVEQAKQAVATVMASPALDSEVPWFWSDQFELKIKIAGILNGSYETTIRGNPDSNIFALYHHRDERIVAVESVNSPRDFMAAKQLIASNTKVIPSQLSDPAMNLRDIIAVTITV